MKRFLKKTIALLLVVCSATLVACSEKTTPPDDKDEEVKNTAIVLAENGQTDYIVVIPENATEAVQYASQLLTKHFEEATGAKLRVEEDGGQKLDSEKSVLSIGKTSILAETELDVSEKTMNYDGFRIKRYGKTVVLCGGTDSGTIYSAQEFLHRQFAYEVYAADESKIEKTSVSYLIDYDLTDIPDFWGRDMDGYLSKNNELAVALRMRTWTMNIPTYDYGAARDWIPNNHHSFRTVLPIKTYGEDHPEWYGTGTQICLTNEELIPVFIQNLEKMIEENPYGKVVNISEEDFGASLGNCCQTCKAEVAAYGKSGYLVRFCNKVITEIEKWLDENYPDRELSYTTFGYTSSGTIQPPVVQQADGSYKVIDPSCVPHEKLYIRFTPLDPVCYSHSFDDPSCKLNTKIAGYSEGWLSITNRFMVYDYDACFRAYLTFHNTYNSLQKNYQFYKKMGVTNIFRQNTTTSTASMRSFMALNTYLNSKLMWNVDEDVNALISEFMTNYYGDGAKYMSELLNLLRSHCDMMDKTLEGGVHHTCYYDVDATQWPISVLEKALALTEKATACYEGLKTTAPERYETMVLRVLQESVCIRWMILENYPSYYNPNSSKYGEMLDQFEIDAEKVGASYHAESNSIGNWIAAKRG